MSSKDLLRNWYELNKGLPKLVEKDVLDLLQQEQKGKRRKDIMERLHQRYSSLRVMRERSEL